MTENINRIKMYKSKKQWVLASTAIITLALIGINGAKANADSTTSTTANDTSQSTTQNTQGNGLNVVVPHDNVDKATQDAKDAGVDVTQKTTTNETIKQADSNQKQTDIANNYNQQTQDVNKVTETQKENTNAYNDAVKAKSEAEQANNQKLSDATNALNDAVKDAQSAGGTVNVTTTDATPQYQKPDNKDAQSIKDSNANNVNAYNQAVADAANKENRQIQGIKDYANTVRNTVAENNQKDQKASSLPTTIDVQHNGIILHLDQRTGEAIFTGVKTKEDEDWIKSRVITSVAADTGATTMDGNHISVNHISGDAYQGALSGGREDNSVWIQGSGHAHDNGGVDTFTFGDGGFYLVPTTVGDMDTPTGPNAGPIQQHARIWTVNSNGNIEFGPVTGPGGIDGNTDSKSSTIQWTDWTNKVIINAYVQDNVDIGNQVTLFGNGRATIDSDFTHALDKTTAVFHTVNATPDPVKADNLKTDVQLHNLTVQPQNNKDEDVNGDGVSDSGKEVAKGDTIPYALNNDPLSANRTDDINKYVVTDVLDPNVATNQNVVDQALKDAGVADLFTATVSGGNEKGGQTVVYTATKTLLTAMNAEKSKQFAVPTIKLNAHATADNVSVKNTFKTTINDYSVTSNVVPNTTPNPKPSKEDLNLQGVDIDGRTVLPGTTNVYKLGWNLDSYRGIIASDDNIKKGFFYVDDYPEEALDPSLDKSTLVDSDGKAVQGVSVKEYDSVDQLPEVAKQAIISSGIKLNGKFVLYTADDPEAFFKNYVETGKNITIMAPMTVKSTFTGTYANTAYQVDFGNGYQTQTVQNNVPPMDASKSVENLDNGSIDNGNVSIGQVFKYVLHSPTIPATKDGLGEPIYQMSGYDALAPEYDQYTGQYRIVSTQNITLKTKSNSDSQTSLWNELKGKTVNGTIPAGTDLSKYVSVTYGNYTLPQAYTFVHDVVGVDGTVYKAGQEVPAGTTIKDVFSWSFMQDFLDQLESTSGIRYDVEIQAKRLKEVSNLGNQASFFVNNVRYKTGVVHTSTVVPKDTPVAPTARPATPTPVVTPVAMPAPQTPSPMPETGKDAHRDSSELLALALASSVATLALVTRKRYA